MCKHEELRRLLCTHREACQRSGSFKSIIDPQEATTGWCVDEIEQWVKRQEIKQATNKHNASIMKDGTDTYVFKENNSCRSTDTN